MCACARACCARAWSLARRIARRLTREGDARTHTRARVAPDADARDGALDAVGLEGFGLSGFALLGGKLRAGEHMDIPGVSNRRATSLLVSVADEPGHAVERPGGPCSLRSPLDGDEGDASLWGEDVPPAPIDVEADGEMVGALPALYECLPGAIDVIC